MQKLSHLRQVIAAYGISEQAIVSDTVEALRQDMDEESTDELVGVQCHGFVPVLFLLAIVFVLKGNAVLIV